jgi:hypothetical protein
MRVKLLLTLFSIWFLFSCTKEKPAPLAQSSLSFKMNGADFKFDTRSFGTTNANGGNFRLTCGISYTSPGGVVSDFPFLLDIRKSANGTICGILLPRDFMFPVTYTPGSCDFDIRTQDVNGNALPIQNIYYYQSGNINFLKSNCGSKPYFNIFCLCTEQAQICDMDGTFTMSFKNGLNEMITITDGKFFATGVFQ